MDDYIKIGKIINTFGIKGELKIDSDFEYKDKVFKKDVPLYIGINKDKELVSTHRVHKNYDLVTFKGYGNINEVLKYKGSFLYVLREDLNLNDDEYLYSDLLYVKVYNDDKEIGIVTEILKNFNNIIIRIKTDTKDVLVPNVPKYIVKFDKNNRILYTKCVLELM